MEKISVYTILYYDLQFYENIIQKIYDYVDEIIIIDGPYSYAIDILKQLNLFYNEENKPSELEEIIKKYSKVKYKYVICDNEEEKRIIGYNMCSNNLVLLIDTDEFLNINIDNLNNFINNKDKYVGCSSIYNMCDYNINFNKLVKKYILFKKEKISALEHLDYTWLIGCKQNKKNIDYMCFSEFGIIYHVTLYRNKKNNIIKFIFYNLLYFKIKNMPLKILNNYDNNILLNNFNLTISEILDIFSRSGINNINIPVIKDNTILELLSENEVKDLKKYDNISEFYFLHEMKCLKNISVYFRLNNLKNEIKILFENIKNVRIKLYKYYLNTNNNIIESFDYQNILDNQIFLKYDLDSNEKYTVIEIVCYETNLNDNVFTIKNIS
jgi:hypothetical protein